ncbi:MAG: alpha/beta hydrolase [Gluconacetobacter diazotrophicus]|nr:alpha/beta hydrolase [Gluconacetobacter diazotrophicus]
MKILRRIAVIGLLWATAASAQPPDAPIEVQTAGHGEPSLVFIPGLACPGSVWEHVVARFEVGYRCHVVTLAGFGGQPPVKTEHFLDDMADAVIAYVRAQKLEKPVLIGHSLGGELAMKIALKAPDLPGRLVIVDSLPFLGTIMGPGIDDAEAAKPAADAYRKTLASMTPGQFAAGQQQYLATMVTSPEKAAEIAAVTGKSDPATTGQAMGELLQTDLRPDLGQIRCPTLVLAALADKVALGVPREAVEGVYRRQYARLPGVRIVFFEKARHFVMVDDLDGFTDALRKELTGP